MEKTDLRYITTSCNVWTLSGSCFIQKKLYNKLGESQGNINTDRMLMTLMNYYYFLNYDNGYV